MIGSERVSGRKFNFYYVIIRSGCQEENKKQLQTTDCKDCIFIKFFLLVP